MKRALAARAKHDPNGLASVVSSSPQPPVKIQRIEEKHDKVTSSISREKEEPSTIKPIKPNNVSSSKQPQKLQSLSQTSNDKQNSVSISIQSSDKGGSTPKSKQSMKRQRSSQTSPDDDDDTDKSSFFLKHQNAALASELQQLRYQFKLLEKEREFRRAQCELANQSLHSLEATWNAMEVALQLGQQPDHTGEQEKEGSKTLAEDTPRSTGTGESVEFIGALLDSLAAIAKEPLLEESSSPEDKEITDVQRTAASVSKRATALQRWIWGLLRKVMSGEEAGKPPLLKLAKLEAKSSTLKSQIRDFQSQIAELSKTKDDAIDSERKVRRGLYRLNAGRMKLDEVMEAIETDDRDGSAALMAVEENAAPAAASAAEKDGEEDGVDGAQLALLRKQLRDLEEISASREKQIDDLARQREANMKRINELALPSDSATQSTKVITDDDIKSSELYTNTWTRMTTAERQLGEMQTKLAETKECWATSRGDADLATKTLEEHLIKHKKRWAELTETPETENGNNGESPIQTEAFLQAESIAELQHKLKQALENVRRADVVRLSLDELSQANETLQSRLNELKTRNAALIQHSKQTAKAETVASQEKAPSKTEAPNADKTERLHKEHRRMRRDLAAAMASKENAKAKLERSEKERDSLLKTNSRLVKQSAEKDEMNAKSLSTILHLKSVTEKLSQERELLEQQVKSAGQVNVAARLAANARERVTDEALTQRKVFEEKVAALEVKCESLMVDNEKAIGDLAQKHSEMGDLEKDASTAKERCDELVAASTKIEGEKRKIVESLAVAQREAGDAAKLIGKMRSQRGGGSSDFTAEQLTTQISVLKNRLACPVCNHRDKSCIVIRCRHMFCKHCIDENVKNRNRKCPSCGQRFDTKDVEDIWL